jgi:hypothetical protein
MNKSKKTLGFLSILEYILSSFLLDFKLRACFAQPSSLYSKLKFFKTLVEFQIFFEDFIRFQRSHK